MKIASEYDNDINGFEMDLWQKSIYLLTCTNTILIKHSPGLNDRSALRLITVGQLMFLFTGE